MNNSTSAANKESFDVQAWGNSFKDCLKFSPGKLSHQDVEVLTNLFVVDSLVAEGRDLDSFALESEEIKEEFLYKVINKRLELYRIKLSLTAKLLLFILSKTPGEAVMYISYMQWYASTIEKKPHTHFTAIKISEDIIPNGPLSEINAEELWLKQKIERGLNALDSGEVIFLFNSVQ